MADVENQRLQAIIYFKGNIGVNSWANGGIIFRDLEPSEIVWPCQAKVMFWNGKAVSGAVELSHFAWCNAESPRDLGGKRKPFSMSESSKVGDLKCVVQRYFEQGFLRLVTGGRS